MTKNAEKSIEIVLIISLKKANSYAIINRKLINDVLMPQRSLTSLLFKEIETYVVYFLELYGTENPSLFFIQSFLNQNISPVSFPTSTDTWTCP